MWNQVALVADRRDRVLEQEIVPLSLQFVDDAADRSGPSRIDQVADFGGRPVVQLRRPSVLQPGLEAGVVGPLDSDRFPVDRDAGFGFEFRGERRPVLFPRITVVVGRDSDRTITDAVVGFAGVTGFVAVGITAVGTALTVVIAAETAREQTHRSDTDSP